MNENHIGSCNCCNGKVYSIDRNSVTFYYCDGICDKYALLKFDKEMPDWIKE